MGVCSIARPGTRMPLSGHVRCKSGQAANLAEAAFANQTLDNIVVHGELRGKCTGQPLVWHRVHEASFDACAAGVDNRYA